ncbi:MAG TPA: hypothetical protein VMW75_12170 [Thermoanaerobaculia bacterium]|nr:hypothetical protein [Thermoanaerobaculia bacterium]
MKKIAKHVRLSRETLLALDAPGWQGVAGGFTTNTGCGTDACPTLPVVSCKFKCTG